jgi:thiamine biosynthesis lipoprotein ApbE
MSKYVKISQQMQEEQQPQEEKKISNIDQANIQKLKSLKGNMTTQGLMVELTKIAKGPGTDAQKEAQALKFLQATMNKLTPMAQFLNTLGVKLPGK